MASGSEINLSIVDRFDSNRARILSFYCYLISAIGTAISAYGFIVNTEQFAFSWLWSFMVIFSIVVGSLFWTILHTATDSEWGVLIRRQMENLSSTLAILPLLFLPLLLFGAPYLWKWWGKIPGQDPLLEAKVSFLNIPFFTTRAFLYFIGLGGVALLLRKFSVNQDRDGASAHTIKMRKVAIAGLPIFAVCLTFAAVDWLMGLDYHWFSTMWGVYIFAGAAGSSMSVLVLLITWLKKCGHLKLVNNEHYHVMGKFLLAFTVFWAYIGYSQYMLIWYANMPEETVYFKIRNTDSWHILSTLLVVGRFFLPFPVLLFQGAKKRVAVLCGISVWIILMQILDLYVVVLPSLHQSGLNLSVYDLSSLVAITGFVAAFYLQKLSSANLIPSRDPRLLGSLKLSN